MNDVEPVAGQQFEQNESLNNNSKSRRGGVRPGAGRPKGSMEKSTLERLAIRKRFEDRIHHNADRLLNAALTKALGESFLMHKYTVGSGTKARTVIDVVEDVETIIAYLNDELNNSGDEDWYYISTKPVDMVAVKELYDRAFGKPLQKNELTGKDGEPFGVVVAPEQADQLLKLRAKRANSN
jgi:hypothetical protein